jgi:hypothetical protein
VGKKKVGAYGPEGWIGVQAEPQQVIHGDWRLAGVEPDQVFDHKFANSAQLPYDPTNGLISLGNIWTSQRGKDSITMPPVREMLAVH